MILQNSGFTLIKPLSLHYPPMFNCYPTTQVTCGCQERVPSFFSCSQLGVKEEPSHLLNHIFMTPYQPIQGPRCASAVCNTSGKTAWDYPLEIVFN